MSARLSGVFNCTSEGWREALAIQSQHGPDTFNLWLWLHGNSVCFHFTGLTRFFTQQAASDLKLSSEEVTAGLLALEGAGLIFWDQENDVLYVPDVVDCQPNISFNKSRPDKQKQNTNITHAQTQMLSLPDCALVSQFALAHGLTNPHSDEVRSGKVREGVPNGGSKGITGGLAKGLTEDDMGAVQ